MDSGINSLVPDINTSLLEWNVRVCPQLIKSNLIKLFPSKDFTGRQLTIISFSHRTNADKNLEDFGHVFDYVSGYKIIIRVLVHRVSH